MRTSIKLYEINTAFHEAMILCFRILLTKDFDVIKKDAIYDGAVVYTISLVRSSDRGDSWNDGSEE